MTAQNSAALMVAKHKLNELLTNDKFDAAYWQYMSLLAIYNMIGAIVDNMKADAFVKPEEVKK